MEERFRFWKANALQMWYIQADESTINPRTVALFCRKANLAQRQQPITYSIRWTDYGTCEFKKVSIMESQELSEKMSVQERIYQVLSLGPRTVSQIADELDLEADTIRKTVTRCAKKGKTFIILDGGGPSYRVGLLQRDKLSRSVPGHPDRTTGQDTPPPMGGAVPCPESNT